MNSDFEAMKDVLSDAYVPITGSARALAGLTG